MKNLNFLRNLFGPAAGLQSNDVSVDRHSTVVRPSFDRRDYQLKRVTRLAAMLCLLFTLGVGNAWGDSFTWDLTIASHSSASNTTVTWTHAAASMELSKGTSGTNANNYLGGANTHTRMYSSQVLTITPNTGTSISSVVITCTGNSYVSGFNSTWTNAGKSVSGAVATITPTDGSSEFSCTLGSGVRVSSVAVTYISSAGGNVTDAIVATDLAATGTTYTAFSNVAKASNARYAGKSAKNSNAIQLRSTGSDCGIVSTISGGTIVSITVDWNSGTAADRTLDIYGKNTAYSSAEDLYDSSTRGTKLGSIVKGTSTELIVSDSYEYIGIRSNSNALMVDKIYIVWSPPGAPETYTVSYAAGGGSGTNPGAHTDVASGSSITLKANTFTAPAGKQFAGWNDGSTTRAAGVSYTVTGDVTMTAVWECITPTISSQTIANANYTVGQSPVAALSVTATGGTLSYQWQSSSSENGTYSNVSGATSSSFTPPVTAASDLWYRCVVKNTGSSCNTTTYSNKAHIVVTVPTPTITVSPTSLTGVGYSTVDFSQQVKSFTVSGTNLTANVSVAPPSGFEICLTAGGTYQTSAISVSYGSGTLSATTIYVRLCSGKAAGNYSGNITCSSTDATNKTVALSGSVPFTVTWQANGSTYATTYVAYSVGGTALGTVPDLTPDLEDYCGHVFYGWYDGNSYQHATDAPSVVNASTTITTNKTYNAVFADYDD